MLHSPVVPAGYALAEVAHGLLWRSVMTTNLFDRVIARQRRLMFFNVAAIAAFATSWGASLLSLI